MQFKILNGTPYITGFYRLRHQVFNLERGFNLPEMGGFEADEFDQLALAFGVVDGPDVVAGLRLIPRTPHSFLPIEVKATMLLGPSEVAAPVELSRLVVAVGYRSNGEMSRGLIEAVVSVARSCGASHLFAVMEPALVVGMKRFGLEFEENGDEFDWNGRVRPYVKTLH